MHERKAYDSKASVDTEAQGRIHAVVSCFNNVDSDGDVMLPGSFKSAIEGGKAKGKLPPGVWAHNWEMPVAKTLDAYEDAEGLHVLAQFNLKTVAGHDAFSNIEQGIITEYSFGFRATDYDQKASGGREIKSVEWFEWSPVLVGANRNTRTVSAKGLGSGLDKAAHSEAVVTVVSDYHARLREHADFREKDGRVLSRATCEQIEAVMAALEKLLAEARRSGTPPEALKALTNAAINRARALGVPIQE
jgi:HK97 family phage prohead protease